MTDTNKVVSLRGVRASLTLAASPPRPASVSIFTPDDDGPPVPPDHLSTTVLMRVADDKDALMFRGFGPALFGQDNVPDFESLHAVKILKGRPIYQFMEAVWQNDLKRLFVLAHTVGNQIRDRINIPQFFYFTGSSDVCFVTPAHLARSLDMVVALQRRFDVHFDVPDSEGRLPQLYWARHARDPYMFVHGQMSLGMNMDNGGRVAGVASELHSTPIWEAVEHQNPMAAKGLALCGTGTINTPRPHDWGRYTPLMVQAVQTSEALFEGRPEAVRGLKTTWNLARAPHMDWERVDVERQTIRDFPLNQRVNLVLERGKAAPFGLVSP